ncbi:hypothetical protein M885DRAFT_517773 [Pelagophyceae sp. CCMP2097]|nr:hypothetical protein M885DRAFT_517773 [Pelagophyceae sp. CCMP2097]|mmetsp:Transcript_3357/g.10158  ORF Transcript_3357/g.10158 Transcript_3357/m.10158 type:complete len:310 (+) Transcript_3357:73-1002(+)
MDPARLDFHESLCASILAGTKRATTRVQDEVDPNSDLERLAPTVRCAATSQGAVFAHLVITRTDAVRFGDVDDALAALEGCDSGEALQKLLLKFYPNLTPASHLVVYHFRLCDAPAPIPWALGAAVAAIEVVGKAGDVFGSTLSQSRPLLLLSLNANDLHCVLTAGGADFAPWLAVAALRRLSEDPLFYWLGYKYRDAGILRWLGVDAARGWFRKASVLAVLIEPNALVCCLAGAQDMPPTQFAALNVAGTLARLLLLRLLAHQPRIQTVVDFVQRHGRYALAIMLAAVLVRPISARLGPLFRRTPKIE